MTGGRLHPFTVKFSLNGPPQGVYHLRIAMLYETPRLSFLKLDLNGRSGYFYFHPTLDFNAGDWEGTSFRKLRLTRRRSLFRRRGYARARTR